MKGIIIFKNNEFQLRKIDDGVWLLPKGITFSHCSICGKRRQLLSHHIVPKRCQCRIKGIKDFMIRICNECEKKVHPEYNGVWKDLKERGHMQDRLGEQKKQIDSLLKKIERYNIPSRKWYCDKCDKQLPIKNIDGRIIMCFNGRHEEWVSGRSPKSENIVNPYKLCPKCKRGKLYPTTNKKVKRACGRCNYKELA